MAEQLTTKKRQNLAAQKMAMPDGSYPIRNVEDLANAIQSFGRASDKAAVKKWIIKRAHDLNAVNSLPAKWRKTSVVQHDDILLAGENYLSHYGVLGMHWGRHLAGRTEESHNPRPQSGRLTKTPKNISKPGSHPDRQRVDQIVKKPVHQLSNNEVKAANSRFEMEKKLSSLKTERTTISRGYKYVLAAVAVATTATTIYNLATSKAGQAVIKKGAEFLKKTVR